MSGQRRTFELPDGRMLTYTEHGPRTGVPLFYNHGFTSSRREYEALAPLVAASGLPARVIAVDRPGIGGSTFDPDRTIGGWARDVAHLADHLGIDRFATLGVSGGGPYALSIAAGLGDRVTRCGVVVGMGPREAPGVLRGLSMLLPLAPGRVRDAAFRFVAFGVGRQPDSYIKGMKRACGPADRDALKVKRVRDGFIYASGGSFAQGHEGVTKEAELYGRTWDFDLSSISAPTHLWYGARDGIVPAAVGEYLVDQIDGAELTTWAEHGHVSWMVRDGLDVVQTLTGGAPATIPAVEHRAVA